MGSEQESVARESPLNSIDTADEQDVKKDPEQSKEQVEADHIAEPASETSNGDISTASEDQSSIDKPRKKYTREELLAIREKPEVSKPPTDPPLDLSDAWLRDIDKSPVEAGEEIALKPQWGRQNSMAGRTLSLGFGRGGGIGSPPGNAAPIHSKLIDLGPADSADQPPGKRAEGPTGVGRGRGGGFGEREGVRHGAWRVNAPGADYKREELDDRGKPIERSPFANDAATKPRWERGGAAGAERGGGERQADPARMDSWRAGPEPRNAPAPRNRWEDNANRHRRGDDAGGGHGGDPWSDDVGPTRMGGRRGGGGAHPMTPAEMEKERQEFRERAKKEAAKGKQDRAETIAEMDMDELMDDEQRAQKRGEVLPKPETAPSAPAALSANGAAAPPQGIKITFQQLATGAKPAAGQNPADNTQGPVAAAAAAPPQPLRLEELERGILGAGRQPEPPSAAARGPPPGLAPLPQPPPGMPPASAILMQPPPTNMTPDQGKGNLLLGMLKNKGVAAAIQASNANAAASAQQNVQTAAVETSKPVEPQKFPPQNQPRESAFAKAAGTPTLPGGAPTAFGNIFGPPPGFGAAANASEDEKLAHIKKLWESDGQAAGGGGAPANPNVPPGFGNAAAQPPQNAGLPTAATDGKAFLANLRHAIGDAQAGKPQDAGRNVIGGAGVQAADVAAAARAAAAAAAGNRPSPVPNANQQDPMDLIAMLNNLQRRQQQQQQQQPQQAGGLPGQQQGLGQGLPPGLQGLAGQAGQPNPAAAQLLQQAAAGKVPPQHARQLLDLLQQQQQRLQQQQQQQQQAPFQQQQQHQPQFPGAVNQQGFGGNNPNQLNNLFQQLGPPPLGQGAQQPQLAGAANLQQRMQGLGQAQLQQQRLQAQANANGGMQGLGLGGQFGVGNYAGGHPQQVPAGANQAGNLNSLLALFPHLQQTAGAGNGIPVRLQQQQQQQQPGVQARPANANMERLLANLANQANNPILAATQLQHLQQMQGGHGGGGGGHPGVTGMPADLERLLLSQVQRG